MKKSWIITVIYCLLIIGGGIFVVFFPRTVPFEQCSDEYKRYADVEGIEASFIKDFYINDTVTLDVTVLKALDSNNFQLLKKHFRFSEILPRQKQRIANGEDVIFVKCIFNDSILADYSSKRIKEVVAISYISNTFTIFHLNKDSESQAIIHYSFPSLEN